MSTENKFKELQEQGRRVLEGAIQVNAKIENAEESYQRLLPTLLKKYNVESEEALLALLDKWDKENEANYKKSYEAYETLAKQVQDRNAAIRQIQDGVK